MPYEDRHTEHGDDCMSPWGEHARSLLSAETIAANHQLHMADVKLAAGHEGHETQWPVAGAPGVGKTFYCNTCKQVIWSDVRVMEPWEVV